MKKSSSPISLINYLILEILSRLPSKSVARFHCVSKLWDSMLGSPYFKELFMTRSSAKQRLLFAIHENGVWSFFSSPQSSSTLVADAEFHVKFSPKDLKISYCADIRKFSCGYASGLLYMYGDRYEARPVKCNPIIGRYAILPNRYTYRRAYSFFGFDPIDKQHKALSMAYPFGPGHHKILTFGDGDMMITNTLQPVEIQCFGEEVKNCCSVLTFLNHVEDLDVNDINYSNQYILHWRRQNIWDHQIQNQTDQKGQGEEDRDKIGVR
ncbi:PREDICTED: F-box protein At2g16450-like [Camelina sativa]|uniref:F-box protein At2g16450-like n=1 Tax=Camelina sativa TaxID=90675 RepID=A0ABM0T0W6_CAMSA|nr:PREDICTED: F-box protein At2g16450-like [Camelina sativa]